MSPTQNEVTLEDLKDAKYFEPAYVAGDAALAPLADLGMHRIVCLKGDTTPTQDFVPAPWRTTGTEREDLFWWRVHSIR